MRHEPTGGYEDPSLNYRVTWVGHTGETFERIFKWRDDAWDFYQSKGSSATYEFIPAEGAAAPICDSLTCPTRKVPVLVAK